MKRTTQLREIRQDLYELGDLEHLEVELDHRFVRIRSQAKGDITGSTRYKDRLFAVLTPEEWYRVSERGGYFMDCGALIELYGDRLVRHDLYNFQNASWQLPLELIKVAYRRATRVYHHQLKLSRQGQLKDRWGDNKEPRGVGVLRLEARHAAFWTPHIETIFTPDAAAIYRENPLLAPEVERLQDIARNQSQSRRTVATLYLSKDSEQSLYFQVKRSTGRITLSGGVIWHGDHYSIHT